MDIQQESVHTFAVGHGGADAVGKPIVAAGYAPKAYKSVRVRAATANTITVYVGPVGVSMATGYPLPAGEELEVKIENPSKICVVAEPAGNSQQIVTISGDIAGDTFTLANEYGTTDPLSVNATAEQVETALQLLPTFTGNCAVTGDPGGPYTVEFDGDLAKTDVPLLVGTGIGVNETQTIEVTGGEAGDMLVLTAEGVDSDPVAYDTDAAGLQAALDTLPGLAGNTSVTGDGPYAVEFINDLASLDVSALTGVCGKNEVQNIEVIGGVAGDMLVLTYDGVDSTPVAYNTNAAGLQAALESIPTLTGNTTVTGDGPYDVEFIAGLARTDVGFISGTCGKNEQQTISLDEGVTDGTFTLTAAAETTGNIAFDATGADIQAALILLSTIGEGQVSVTGPAGGPWVAEFTGTLAHTDVVALTGDGANLVGEIKTVSIEETVKGNGAAVAVAESVKGREATVTVTETQKGNAAPTVAVTKTDASAGSQYSWIAV